MKIRLEIDETLTENEIVIKCREYTNEIKDLHQAVLSQTPSSVKIAFYKGEDEFFFPLDNILFFETDDETIYAHIKVDAFKVKERLYQLDNMLPHNFVRISKSCIVNTKHIYSISRNLTAASLIEFHGSSKQVYASRHYYKFLRDNL